MTCPPFIEEAEQVRGWYALIDRVYQLAEANTLAQRQTLWSELWEPGAQTRCWAPVFAQASAFLGTGSLCVSDRQKAPGDDWLTHGLTPLQGLGQALVGPDLALPAEMTGFERHPQYLHVQLLKGAEGSATHRRRIEAFAKHVDRCMQLRHRLAMAHGALLSLYDALKERPIALVLCDGQGRPVFANEAAKTLLAKHSALRLGSCGLQIHDSLYKALGQVFDHWRCAEQQGNGAFFRVAAGPFWLSLLPLPGLSTPVALARGGPSMVLRLEERAPGDDPRARFVARPKDMASHRHPPPLLRRHLHAYFNLTHKEIGLAYGIYRGLSVNAFAALERRSPLTVRKQLKSVFRKLQVHDQKNLVLRLWKIQLADWGHCVSLLPLHAARDAPCLLLYPRPQGAAAEQVAPAASFPHAESHDAP